MIGSGATGAAALLMLAGCASRQPLRVGYLGGLTGRIADLGIGARNGAQLAVDDLNAAGGINGRPVELISLDDEQDAEIGRARLVELFDRHVALVVGPVTKPMAKALLPVANERGIPLISPMAGAPEFSGRKDAFFRVVSSVPVSAQQMADELLRRGLRRSVSVADMSNPVFSQAWAGAFSQRFAAGGGTALPALEFEAEPGLRFLDQSARIADTQADAVVIVASATDSSVLVQQVRRLKPELVIALSVWAGTEELPQLGGRAMDGVLVSQFFDRFNATPRWLDFVARFATRFGQTPGYAAMNGYDALQMAAAGLRNADQAGLLASLAQVRELEGLQRPLSFDEFGDCLAPTYLTEVRAGRYIAVAG